MTIEQIIGEWREGSALSAGSHIRGAEIRYHRNAQALCQDTTVAELQRARHRVAEHLSGAPLVENCLSVASDKIHFLAEREDGLGVKLGKQIVQPGDVGGVAIGI